jgi:hypothetical protein
VLLRISLEGVPIRPPLPVVVLPSGTHPPACELSVAASGERPVGAFVTLLGARAAAPPQLVSEVGAPLVLLLRSRDRFGNAQSGGGDTWEVVTDWLIHPYPPLPATSTPTPTPTPTPAHTHTHTRTYPNPNPNSNQARLVGGEAGADTEPPIVADHGDGTYALALLSRSAGLFSLEVRLCSAGRLYAPFTCIFKCVGGRAS